MQQKIHIILPTTVLKSLYISLYTLHSLPQRDKYFITIFLSKKDQILHLLATSGHEAAAFGSLAPCWTLIMGKYDLVS